jgi:hypothetical protein
VGGRGRAERVTARSLLVVGLVLVFAFAHFSSETIDAIQGERTVPDWPPAAHGAAAAGAVLLAALSAASARLLHRLGRRKRLATPAPPPPDVPPVLYLRPFDQDAAMGELGGQVSLLTYEEQLREAFRTVGPLVAIGRPGEPLPELGAGRLYVGDDRWRAVVLDLLGRARLVVLGLGPGEGLRWEVERATRLLPAQRLVLLLPSDPGAYDASVRLLAGHFPRGLPPYPGGRSARRFAVGAAVWFRPDWTPVAVLLGARRALLQNESLETACVIGLRPVYAQVGASWPGIRLPGIAATRRGCARGCLGALALFVLLALVVTVVVLTL